MSSIVAVPPTGSSGMSLFAAVGLGVGGLFVAFLLAYLQGYSNVINASVRSRKRLRSLLIAVSIPLLFAFGAVILFRSLTILGLL